MAKIESLAAKTDKPAPAKPEVKQSGKPKKLPPYHVVLMDDDDHSYEYVVAMLKRLFGYPDHMSYKLADECDSEGRAVVYTTHRELAELKCEQIHSFGADEYVATCQGSMSAYVEPAPGA